MEMSPIPARERNCLDPIRQSGVCLGRFTAFLTWGCWRNVNLTLPAIKHQIPLMPVDVTRIESQSQWDEGPHKTWQRWDKMLQEKMKYALWVWKTFKYLLQQWEKAITHSSVSVTQHKPPMFHGANLILCVKNPEEKHLALFSRSTYCDLGHGHRTDSLLVAKTERPEGEDPAFLAVSFMLMFERQFAYRSCEMNQRCHLKPQWHIFPHSLLYFT